MTFNFDGSECEHATCASASKCSSRSRKMVCIISERKPTTPEAFPLLAKNSVRRMEQFALGFESDLSNQVENYIKRLPDEVNSRPYCAGQKALNEVTLQIIAQAKTNGWSTVPDPVSYTHLTLPTICSV